MHASWPQLLLLVFAWRRGSMGFGCPLHSIPWPSTYPTRPSSFPPMLRHPSVGDVGNLSGQPNPHLSCLRVSTQAWVCTRGFLLESLRLCRQSRRSQTSQWLRKHGSYRSLCIGRWGTLVTATWAGHQPDVTRMPHNTVQHLCAPSLNTYTLHAKTMETIRARWFWNLLVFTLHIPSHIQNTQTQWQNCSFMWLGLHVTQEVVCSRAHQASAFQCFCWSGQQL